MFKGTTGVLVAENRNSGGLNINIRGMQGQGRVPVLVDGARQETTVYRGYAGVTSRSYVDPDLIGGVEIDKGPTMGASGTGAIGGLVSMHTLNADDIAKPGNDWGCACAAAWWATTAVRRRPSVPRRATTWAAWARLPITAPTASPAAPCATASIT